MNFRAVFLDAGETLLSPHPSFAEVVADELLRRGRKTDVAQVEEALMQMPPLADQTEPWSISPETSRLFWTGVYQRLLEMLAVQDAGDELAAALYERFTRYESYRMFPEAVGAIQTLKRAGLKVGLISNFEEWLIEMLTHWEVAVLFDVMVVSGKEGIEKPDREIFERALDRAGVPAADAVYVGDHPRIDIEAAEAVGMTAVLIDRRDRFPDFEGARITSLDELPPLVVH